MSKTYSGRYLHICTICGKQRYTTTPGNPSELCRVCYSNRQLSLIVRCSTCHEEKLLSAFHKARSQPPGYKYQCKACCKTRRQERNRANPGCEARAAKAWRERDPERARAIDKSYKKRHRATLLARGRHYSMTVRALHPEINRARSREYYVKHPEQWLEYGSRRRARKKGAPRNDLTAAQWHEIQVAYDHRCVYCGKRVKGHLTQDHLTPLSKGGSHTVSNIVPACGRCNRKKQAGPPLIPVQPLLLTLA